MSDVKQRPPSFFTRSFSVNNFDPENVAQLPSIPIKDTHDTKIEHFVITPNHNIIIADETNASLKMLNIHGDFIFELVFQTKPTGMCMLAPTLLIITLPAASILAVIKINKRNISVEAGLKTKNGYELLAGSKDRTLVCSHGRRLDVYTVGPQYSLRLLHFIDISYNNLSMVASPRISLTDDSMVLVGNILDSTLSVYNNVGELIACETIPSNCSLSDMAYFNNHIYLADYKEDRILQLTMDLKLVTTINLSESNERLPTKIAISSKGVLALLYTSFHSVLQMYTL